MNVYTGSGSTYTYPAMAAIQKRITWGRKKTWVGDRVSHAVSSLLVVKFLSKSWQNVNLNKIRLMLLLMLSGMFTMFYALNLKLL